MAKHYDGEIKFRITSYLASPEEFGPCQICGCDMLEVFVQTRLQWIDYDGGYWFQTDPQKFGHERCLINSRCHCNAAPADRLASPTHASSEVKHG